MDAGEREAARQRGQMDAGEREAARQRGQRKLEAMRRRAGKLRRRVVASAVVGFVVLWTAIFVQMATGHDPVLGTTAAAVRAAVQEDAASDPERRGIRAATAPPRRDEAEDENEAEEELGAERLEAERLEAERLEAEARELGEAEAEAEGAREAEAEEAQEAEELEAVTTGQS